MKKNNKDNTHLNTDVKPDNEKDNTHVNINVNTQNNLIDITGISQVNIYQYWKLTNNLRWKRKEIKTELSEHITGISHGNVLQQMWISDMGEEKWEDIPEVI